MEPVIYNKNNTAFAVREELAGALPGSISTLEKDGSSYKVFPYTQEMWEAAVRARVRVEPPIYRRYQWSGKYTPFVHQKRVAAFLTYYKRGYNLSDMGTGKTLSSLWAFDYLRSIKLARRLLVLAPLSVCSVWENELYTHFPHLRYATLHSVSAKKAESTVKTLAKEDVLIVNHDAVRTTKGRLFLEGKPLHPDILVVDEGSMFRTYGTDKLKGLHAIARKVERVWWMTATPTPNAPTDAWAQALVMGTTKGVRLGEFRDRTMKQVSEYKWVSRPEAEEAVKQLLSPSIRFRAEDCIDLPSLTYQTRKVEMTPDQRKAYRQLEEEAILEMKSGQIVTAVNAAVKLNKLIQLSCGILYDDDGDTAELEATHKLGALAEIMEETASPVIVFAPYKSVVRYLADKLKDYGPAVVMGDTPVHERKEIVARFQEGKTRLLIAHPRTMAHGLTLTASSTVVWYAPIHSNDEYTQANGRIYRQGQEKPCSVIHLVCSRVEAEVFTKLKERQKVQAGILELLATRR